MQQLPKIAIIGKPNVGKSTLFNRLCRKRLAIIDDKPGVTRDSKEYYANIADLEFIAIDTAGWENIVNETKTAWSYNTPSIKELVINQTIKAIEKADLLIFIVDGQNSITNDDLDFATLSRKVSKPVILVVNKSENKPKINLKELYQLGLGEPIYISAAHSLGFDELYNEIINKNLIKLEEHPNENKSINKEEGKLGNISISIVGRPNVGKSTLFNKILGYERVLTSPEAGTTRDCITETIKFNDYNISMIDTAGMRKRAKIKDSIESSALGQSITSIRRANVIILVMDSQLAFEKQDLAIAKIAINEGKPIILVINKFDLVEKTKEFKKAAEESLENYLTDVYKPSIVYMSALKEHGVQELLSTIIKTFSNWSDNFGTGELNRWLKLVTTRHIPPLASNGRRIRIKYITQIATKPPTFNLFSNIPENLPNSYQRYLKNAFAEHFKLTSTPIRFVINKSANPYVNK